MFVYNESKTVMFLRGAECEGLSDCVRYGPGKRPTGGLFILTIVLGGTAAQACNGRQEVEMMELLS